jgi:hypothetical protein
VFEISRSGSLTLDQDADEQAALKLTVNGGTPIGAAIAGAVPFTAAGYESDDNGSVSFSDGSHAPVVVNITNGMLAATTANLTGLNDGPITATLHLNNDAAGNSFTDVTTSATLDQDTGEQSNATLSGLTDGNAVQDQTVTATVSDSNDGDLQGPITYTWQTNDGQHGWQTVLSSTSNSYTPNEVDEGSQLQVLTSFTDAAGNTETGVASAGTVFDIISPALTAPVISGTAQEGQTLTAAVSRTPSLYDVNLTVEAPGRSWVGFKRMGTWAPCHRLTSPMPT